MINKALDFYFYVSHGLLSLISWVALWRVRPGQGQAVEIIVTGIVCLAALTANFAACMYLRIQDRKRILEELRRRVEGE